MNRIGVAARLVTRSLQTSTRSRGPVSMKEPYSQKGDGGASGGVIPGSAGYQNIVRLQTLWSVEDGTMVWQKKGTDTVLYNATLALCAVSVVYVVYLLGVMSFPKKQE